MGCGNSKNKIHVSANGTAKSDNKNSATTQKSSSRPRSKTIRVKPSDNTVDKTSKKTQRSTSKSSLGSQDSLGGRSNVSGSGSDGRGGSATSKASKHSGDSGYDEDEYRRVITEFSQEKQVQEVEEDFNTPRNLDLGVTGKQCQQRLSGNNKDRQDEQRVLLALRQEGLIQRPVSRAAFGVSFDIVAEDGDDYLMGQRRAPARLAKLERRKRRKRELTEEEIQAKLERAERRRKAKEQQRLAKIQAVTNKSDVQNALDAFAQTQKSKEEEEKTKQDQATENRMKRIQEMQEKLRAKQEKVAAARERRRKLGPAPLNSEDVPVVTSQKVTDDTPVAASTGYSLDTDGAH